MNALQSFSLALLSSLFLVTAATAQEDGDKRDAEKPLILRDDKTALPERAVARLGSPGLFHKGVATVLFSADGKQLITLGSDHTVRYWSLPHAKETGQLAHAELAFPSDREDLPREFAMFRGGRIPAELYFGVDRALRRPIASHSGQLLAVPRSDGSFVLWDVHKKERRERLEARGTPLALSPDDKTVVLSARASPELGLKGGRFDVNDGALQLIDIGSGKEKQRFKTREGMIFAAAFSPDGRFLAARTELGVVLWDMKTGKRARSYGARNRGVSEMVFSPDGRYLLTSSMEGFTVWETDSEEELAQVRSEDAMILAADFGRDGKSVYSIDIKGNLRWWDWQNSKEIKSWDLNGIGSTLRLSPDGKWLVVTGEGGIIRLWDIEAAREVAPPTLAPIKDVALLDRGSIVMTTTSGQAYQAQWSTGIVERRQTRAREGAAMAQPPLMVVMRDEAAVFCDLFTDKEYFTRALEMMGPGCIASDGRYIAMVASNTMAEICVVSLADGKEVEKWSWPTPVRAMAFSPDEKTVALYSAGQIDLVERATRKSRRTIVARESDAEKMLFSPDGRQLIAIGHDRIVRVWDRWTGEIQHRLAGHAGSIESMRTSRDGSLATCDSDGVVIIWDLKTGKEKMKLLGHRDGVSAVCFSPDGRFLATGSLDQTVLVWDLGAAAASIAKKEARPLPELWKDLAHAEADVAGEAMTALLRREAETVAWLRKNLPPVTAAQEETIQQLIADLGDARYPVREKATAALERLESLAEGYLQKALEEKPAPEKQKRLAKLLAQLKEPVVHPEALRRSRAVEVLEYLGTPAAREYLRELSRGVEGARLTRLAREALGRMEVSAGKE